MVLMVSIETAVNMAGSNQNPFHIESKKASHSRINMQSINPPIKRKRPLKNSEYQAPKQTNTTDEKSIPSWANSVHEISLTLFLKTIISKYSKEGATNASNDRMINSLNVLTPH